jgi:hypothetical protein
VANGHREVAEHLLEQTDRTVLALTDRHGRTPLHYASGAQGIAEHEERAVGDVSDDDDAAAADSARNMYRWLIEMGADDTKTDLVSMKIFAYILYDCAQKTVYLFYS